MKTIKIFAFLSMLSMLMLACTVVHYGDEDDDNNNSSSGGSNNLKTGQIEMKVYPDNDNKVSFWATTGKITIDWGDGYIDKLTLNGNQQEFYHTYPNNNLKTIYIESEKLQGLGKGGGRYAQIWGGKGVIKELYLGEMNELNDLFCSNGGLTVLEIKKAHSLFMIDCSRNQLTSLDLRGCSIIPFLLCQDNQLTSLIRGSTKVGLLDCSNNQLTSLDVRDSSLGLFNCSNNQLTALDIRGCIGLYQFDCSRNELSSNDLNSLFENLQDINNSIYGEWGIGELKISGNSGYSSCNKAIAINKGWKEVSSLSWYSWL